MRLTSKWLVLASLLSVVACGGETGPSKGEPVKPLPAGGPFSLPENSAAGTAVGTVANTTAQAGVSYEYKLLSGNNGSAFAIGATGELTVATPAAVNFEERQ